MSPSIKRLIWGAVAVMISALLMAWGTAFYVAHEINESEAIMCDVLETIYQPTPEAPLPDPEDPAQQRAHEVRNKIGEAIHKYDCR